MEREAFLGLRQDYHRDAFIRKFWQVRDPYPETGRNELKENWDERVFQAESEFETLDDDRARILLVHGPPDATMEVRCTTTRTPVTVWLYDSSEVVDFRFLLVFVRAGLGKGRAAIWRPGSGPLEGVISMARECINGSRLDGLVTELRDMGGQYDLILDRVLAKPRPHSEEWVATFQAFTAEVEPGAASLDASMSIEFLGRVQSRTVLQTVIEVPRQSAAVDTFAGFNSYNFELTGEVVLDNQLFETFRYKFGFPEKGVADASIPMAFQRYLRPGDYTLVIKLQDLTSKAVFLRRETLKVPDMEREIEVKSDLDAETMRLFEEAAKAVGGESTAIRLVAPPGDLHSGFERFDTLLSGSNIERVVFYLDSKTAVTKNRPPFNVEIDLGPYPRMHTLRAEAQDAEGNVVAEDELALNAGEHRFTLRLVEPRAGGRYGESLTARAEVELPKDRSLERVEFFLDETKVATLYQKPFVQPLRLPSKDAAAYVRAVAYLADGNTTEDVVFINAADTIERMDIQFVELYAAALDGEGRLIEGLGKTDFKVLEDGVEQEVVRFDRVENLPFHAAILLDNSASMGGALEQARFAALRFFQQAITPRDRAAVITFNRFPNLAVKFTNDPTLLGGGLQGLSAEGQHRALRQPDVHALLLQRHHRAARDPAALGRQGRGEPLRLRGHARVRAARRRHHLLDRPRHRRRCGQGQSDPARQRDRRPQLLHLRRGRHLRRVRPGAAGHAVAVPARLPVLEHRAHRRLPPGRGQGLTPAHDGADTVGLLPVGGDPGALSRPALFSSRARSERASAD